MIWMPSRGAAPGFSFAAGVWHWESLNWEPTLSHASTHPPRHEFVWLDSHEPEERLPGSKVIENVELTDDGASETDSKSIRKHFCASY